MKPYLAHKTAHDPDRDSCPGFVNSFNVFLKNPLADKYPHTLTGVGSQKENIKYWN